MRLYSTEKYSEMDLCGELVFNSLTWRQTETFRNRAQYEKTEEQEVRRLILHFLPAFLTEAPDAHDEIHRFHSTVR